MTLRRNGSRGAIRNARTSRLSNLGIETKVGDPRLRCIIDYDAERVSSLKARYP